MVQALVGKDGKLVRTDVRGQLEAMVERELAKQDSPKAQ